MLEELGRDDDAASWRKRAAVAADVIAGANGEDQWETVEVNEVIEESSDGGPASAGHGDVAGVRD